MGESTNGAKDSIILHCFTTGIFKWFLENNVKLCTLGTRMGGIAKSTVMKCEPQCASTDPASASPRTSQKKEQTTKLLANSRTGINYPLPWQNGYQLPICNIGTKCINYYQYLLLIVDTFPEGLKLFPAKPTRLRR